MLALRRAVPYAAVMMVGAYLYWLALHFEFPAVPGRLGPDAWPKMVLGLLLLTCLVGLITSFKRADAPADREGKGESRPTLTSGPSGGSALGGTKRSVSIPWPV